MYLHLVFSYDGYSFGEHIMFSDGLQPFLSILPSPNTLKYAQSPGKKDNPNVETLRPLALSQFVMYPHCNYSVVVRVFVFKILF